MPEFPSPPPPRSDIPKPEHMTDERYAAYLEYLAGELPMTWRATDGTIYTMWLPSDMAPPIGRVDSRAALPPGDPNYARFVDDLLPHFDYEGKEMPDATSTDSHAEA
jgi:hypothetical protein